MKSLRTLVSRLALAVVVSLAFSSVGLSISSPASAAKESAHARGVDDIDFRGAERSDIETLRSYFKGSDPASINEGVKALQATGRFALVKAEPEHGRWVVTVSENQVINRVAFEGNTKIKSEVIASEIQSKTHGGYNPDTVKADIERINDLYRRAGRSDATVTARKVPLDNGRVDVVFTINEGSKTGVYSIVFENNHVFGSDRLRNLMQTTEMNFLSFIKTSDVYDPDKIASDQELIRRFYLKNGYADFRIVGSDAVYDPDKKGYIITITVDEGAQYTVSDVNVESALPDVPQEDLLRAVRISAGQIYNGDLVEKSTEAVTREVARHGYAFSSARPRGDRDTATHTIHLTFVIEEGPRVYIERINVRGNTRTRDYVIRREFPIGEGDAYNRVLIDKAEKRLNSLGYFKKVKITNEPGSAPDRVVINVDVEDQPTGSFGISGGYSTVDGLVAELSVTESNFMGRGQYARAAITGGLRTRGIEFSFTEPYFLDYRLAAGFDLFVKQSTNNQYSIYDSKTYGGTLRLGVPLTDEITFSPHYSLSQTTISIPNSTSRPYNDCVDPKNVQPYDPVLNPGGWSYFGSGTNPDGTMGPTGSYNCLTNGEASLAIKELAKSPRVVSLVGYSFSYNSLDNPKNPTEGIFAQFSQDVAGLGGNSKFLRTTADARYFYPIWDDVVGFVKVQGGHIVAFGGTKLSVVDEFNLGPSLVRGFAPGGLGPRDNSNPYSTNGNALGGSKYVGATAEVQFPIFGLPKDLGLKGAVFADAGTLFGYSGQTNFGDLFGYAGGSSAPCIAATLASSGTLKSPTPGNNNPVNQGSCINVADSSKPRASVGLSLLWNSPVGPIRFDYAFVLSKYKGTYSPATGTYVGGDVVQAFRFTGGGAF